MSPSRFVRLHRIAEQEQTAIGAARFALLLGRTPEGIALVFSNLRRVWELPGGLIDPGESARDCAAREFREETGGGVPGALEWLGLLEVFEGEPRFGAVYGCEAKSVPQDFQNWETGGIHFWTRGNVPQPIGESDAAVLNRFG
jgi:8-oxo-dGTP diphosphatase